jgi:hypothetical protein
MTQSVSDEQRFARDMADQPSDGQPRDGDHIRRRLEHADDVRAGSSARALSVLSRLNEFWTEP